MMDTLVKESSEGLPLQRSNVLPTLRAGQLDGSAAAKRITSYPDMTSYHLLFALRQVAPDAYRALPDIVKARVLADALAHVSVLNDWGYLDPSASHDGEAAQALLALGAVAVGPLTRLLADDRPAPLLGSEPAAMSRHYRYRRKDFAYRYLSLLTGRTPNFDPDPSARDSEIAKLAVMLRSGNGSAK